MTAAMLWASIHEVQVLHLGRIISFPPGFPPVSSYDAGTVNPYSETDHYRLLSNPYLLTIHDYLRISFDALQVLKFKERF
jgi:hypothetical protein